ncbi:RNA polymerase sigma-70 factor, ECF subfamily [Pedobacter steynii]|uniref:RNA polymerase sigma-70 factor, ECF subfamily n=1 Tax=Pedobacter steynii TaxID=430522 RepID=A0A1H0A5M1_9SPHI|nr:sigma-70 family RNA polymerase sigma factor [Pedobacter steynii]SDN29072.1 RNA polymerase sigma-70 factor, ECF subfamily [Pedobacter steynii]
MILFVTRLAIFCSYERMDHTEDQIYVDRVKNGDTASYSFLLNKYKNMAYTIALKITGNAEEAEDAVQEGFIKAYQAIHSFKGSSKFSTWLYTIVYRTAILLIKDKRIKTSSIDDENYPHDVTDGSVPQLDQLHSDEQAKYVRQAIEKLPKTEALLVTLYYINESTIKEVCEITGLSIPNVKIQLFRARKRLERELKFLL